MAEVPGLVPGEVDPEHLKLLIGFARIRSSNAIEALHSYFVGGVSQKNAQEQHSIGQSQLSQKISEIRKVSELVRKAKKYYPST
jgi:hypothetical protein